MANRGLKDTGMKEDQWARGVSSDIKNKSCKSSLQLFLVIICLPASNYMNDYLF